MKKYLRFLPAIGWMAFIYFLSSRNTTGVFSNDATERFFIFKSFHLIEYAILFLLLYFAIKFASAFKSILVAYLYACTDEYHQTFTPGRTGQFKDTLIDLIGISLGFLFYLTLIYLYQYFLKKHSVHRQKSRFAK